MKRLVTWLLAVTILLPVASTAQTFTFSTNTNPGFTVSTNPWGTGIGLTTPYFNTVYTSDGYYDGYGRYHKRYRKHHRKARPRPPRHYYDYGSGKAHYKAAKKARKAYRKELRKQYKKEAKRYYKRHHHDDDDD